MPNTTIPNSALTSNTDLWSGYWRLTRGLKGAGWRYKASADGTSTTITSGSNGVALPTGTINVTTTATGFAASGTISVTTTNGIQTVTYTGITATTFTGCTGGTGNMATGGLVGGSGTKDTSGNPASDRWGGGVQVGAQTAVAAFTIGTATTTAKGGRVTLTGLTGFATTSPGHYLTITGATNGANNGTWLITAYISATSITIENPAAIAETTPGSATWTEKSALTDTIPASITAALGNGAWWCAEGPSTMKIPIGAVVPAISFIRGENVTQTTSGATGEVLGVLTDADTSLGYIVIAPRVSGTGAAVRGWDSSNIITGAYSGATATPTGTPLEYVREIVIWKNTIALGHVYFQIIDSVNEGTSTSANGRFSTMAALATCTTYICPGGITGGVPTANGFPTTGSYAVSGTAGAGTAATTSGAWIGATTASYGVAQVMCANNIEDANISQDGSYILAIGTPVTSPGTFVGISYQRCDDGEEGDIDPYVHFWNNNVNYASSRTTATTSYVSAENFNAAIFALVNFTPYRGWRRRGFATDDEFQEFQGALLQQFSGTSALNSNTGTVDRVATAITVAALTLNITVREPCWIISSQINQKMRKGTMRWLYFVPFGAGAGTDTYDSKRWIQLSNGTNVIPPMVGGPWDGTTNPTNI